MLLHFGAVDWSCDVWVERQARRLASRRLRRVLVRHHRGARAPRAPAISSCASSTPRAITGSRAASRCASRAASGTPRAAASGRASGSRRCPKCTFEACMRRLTWRRGGSRSLSTSLGVGAELEARVFGGREAPDSDALTQHWSGDTAPSALARRAEALESLVIPSSTTSSSLRGRGIPSIACGATSARVK